VKARVRRESVSWKCKLALTSDRATQHFAILEQNRGEIERAIGSNLTWHNPLGTKQSKIYIRQDADFLNETLWPQQHELKNDVLESEEAEAARAS